MLLNLWDDNEVIHNFVELYNLTGMQICNILRRLHFDAERDNICIFCEETGIKLDEADVAQDIEFLGKIVSTTIDEFKHLQQAGIVPLDVLLENDSPIRRHLKQYQIEISPSTHVLIYKGKKFYIPFQNEDCEWCSYGDERCRYEGQRYKDMYCPYLEAIHSLATKLYSDNCEIEMFLSASPKAMLGYSKVKEYPEIFLTVEQFINTFFGEHLNIGPEWSKLKQQSCILSFPIKYNDMTYRNEYISGNDGGDADDMLLRYAKFCGRYYDYAEQVPNCFWDNIWFINVCLNSICSVGETREQICAGIKHDVSIPYNTIKINLI